MKSGKVEIKSVKAWLKRRSIRFYFITLSSLDDHRELYHRPVVALPHGSGKAPYGQRGTNECLFEDG